jgi:alginate O-acetyltransferase complex protein AlgI
MFPQLVAGPIVRYSDIAKQLRHRVHSAGSFVYGFTRFNYGFAKKILLANPVGEIADLCFSAGESSLSTPAAWIGVICYAFQIYFDFSAYSDMAIGLGRMFGFSFRENFDSPYKSASITEFWRRWHISLSSFLRDYLYIPLGGNRKGISRTYINLIIVMFLGGLWHGAQWTFVLWGLIHGSILVIERISRTNNFSKKLPRGIKVFLTFNIILIAWVFFRAENIITAWNYLSKMFGFGESGQAAGILLGQVTRPMACFMIIISLLAIFVMPNTGQCLRKLTSLKVIVGLLLLVFSVSVMFAQDFNPFLYFQF